MYESELNENGKVITQQKREWKYNNNKNKKKKKNENNSKQNILSNGNIFPIINFISSFGLLLFCIGNLDEA